MAGLQLPVIQNWSCHNCGGCCREHEIFVTDEERETIRQQAWSEVDGIADEPVIRQRDQWILRQRDDGGCVFLQEDGLCRIHAKYGEAAKPLACRVYPYAFHPAGGHTAVSLRFSCPSVARNAGTAITDRTDELKTLARAVLPSGTQDVKPPSIHGDGDGRWPDINAMVAAFCDELRQTDVLLVVRLARILEWLRVIETLPAEKLCGTALQDTLDLLSKAARRAQPDNDLPIGPPNRVGRMHFRMLVAQLSRHDTEATRRGGAGIRWRLFRTAVRFALGTGTIPPIPVPLSVAAAYGDTPATAGTVRFSETERPFQCTTPEIDELLTRYFLVKVEGLHFCGAANFRRSVVDGFRELALMYPVSLWLARVRAVRAGRNQVNPQDVQVGLATADHNFAYSPALASRNAGSRIRQLSVTRQINTLCGWYSR